MLGYLVFAMVKNQDNEKFWLEFERNTDDFENWKVKVYFWKW